MYHVLVNTNNRSKPYLILKVETIIQGPGPWPSVISGVNSEILQNKCNLINEQYQGDDTRNTDHT